MTTYPTFNFPLHSVQDEFPQNSVATRFGNGYSFSSAPVGPPQLVFHLDFVCMAWYTTGSPAGAFDRTYNPTALPGLNLAAMIDFYAAQQLFNPFWYPHQVRGNVLVRFSKPLTTPKSIKGAVFPQTSDNKWMHLTEQLSLELTYQPT